MPVSKTLTSAYFGISLPAARYSAAQSAILKGETTYEEIIDQIEAMNVIGESQKHAIYTEIRELFLPMLLLLGLGIFKDAF